MIERRPVQFQTKFLLLFQHLSCGMPEQSIWKNLALKTTQQATVCTIKPWTLNQTMVCHRLSA